MMTASLHVGDPRLPCGLCDEGLYQPIQPGLEVEARFVKIEFNSCLRVISDARFPAKRASLMFLATGGSSLTC